MTKRVLITGASKGIGKAIASQLASDGFDLVIHYNSDRSGAEKLANTLMEECSVKVGILQFNISNRDETKSTILKDIENNGVYYGVVCNAGISRDNAFPALDDEDWDSVVDTNLGSFYNVLKPIVMPMVRAKKPARIVTMASVSGIIGNRGQVNYSASKAGIIGATKALAVELAKRKITVNCVAPGLINTSMIDDVHLEHVLPAIPMNRVGEPKEVAALVGFLMSENASYITRQVISVNGGLA